MPPRTLRFVWTEEKQNELRALNQCTRWRTLLELLSEKIPNISHFYPMLGVVGVVKAAKKTMSPITFWEENGGAYWIVEEKELPDDNTLQTYVKLLIHYQWSFKAPNPWRSIKSSLRTLGPHQHLTLPEWKDILNDYTFEVEIPNCRSRELDANLKYGQKRIVEHLIKFKREETKSGALKAKLIHNSNRIGVGAKAIRRCTCMFCGLISLPDPVKCVYSKSERMNHYSCLVEFQRKLEKRLLMTTKSFPCPAPKCNGTLPFTVDDNCLPTLEDWHKLMFHVTYCGECKRVIWRSKEKEHLADDCKYDPEIDTKGKDEAINCNTLLSKISLYDEECEYKGLDVSDLQTNTEELIVPELIRRRTESFSSEEDIEEVIEDDTNPQESEESDEEAENPPEGDIQHINSSDTEKALMINEDVIDSDNNSITIIGGKSKVNKPTNTPIKTIVNPQDSRPDDTESILKTPDTNPIIPLRKEIISSPPNLSDSIEHK